MVIGFNTTIAHTDFHPLEPAQRIVDAIAISPLAAGRPRPLRGAWIICEGDIIIGDHVLVSWDVIIIDCRRRPADRRRRLQELHRVAAREPRRLECDEGRRPIRIEDNVWLGFGACVVPGVVIGEGSGVGARSVVDRDVPPYTVVADNPARTVRELSAEGASGDC